MTQTQVISQLHYLVSGGWVGKVSEWYTISANGIDKIEDFSSEFVRQNPCSNINITASNSVVQLGVSNAVHESLVGITNELEQRAKSIVETDLSKEEKDSIIADIEKINGQLAKSEPNKDNIRTVWHAIKSSKAAVLIVSGSAIAKAMESILGWLL